MSGSGIVRAALVAVALLVVAWLAVSVRTSNEEAEGAAVADTATRSTPPGELERATRALEDARLLSLSKEPEIKEAALLVADDRAGEAGQVAARVVAAEPENAEAWFVLWLAAVARRDEAQAARALAQVRTIDPLRARVMRRLTPPGR